MSRRRVVITGMGMLSPLGLDVPSSWEGILAGRSGIAPIEHMDLSAYSTRFGGSVKGFNVEEYLSAKEARKLDLFIQYGLAASFQAVSDSGLEVTDANRERIGVSMGSGIGGLTNIENNCRSLFEQAAAHLAVLRARFDHQHGFRLPVDPPGSAGAQLRPHHRLHHRYPQHRHGCSQHRLWRGRRDGRRRFRNGCLRSRPGRFRRGSRALHSQRRADPCQPSVGPGSRRLRPVRRFRRPGARRTGARPPAARGSMPSWLASA